MSKYKQIIPFRTEVRVDEQFGFKPYSIIKPKKSDKLNWKHAYLNDDKHEKRRSGDAEYLPNLKFSEFHAGLTENILRYWSMEGSRIVDPFSGRVTRAVVSSELKRDYYGYEISPRTYERVQNHLKEHDIDTTIYNDDGILLKKTPDNFADLVFTCPPYYNIEKYESIDGQLSDEDSYESFIEKMKVSSNNCHRVMKEGGFLVWVVGDFREGGLLRNFHGDMINLFEESGLILHDIIVIENISPFAALQLGKVASKRYTSKIHEYIIVMRKEGEYQIPDYCSIDELSSRKKSKQFFDI